MSRSAALVRGGCMGTPTYMPQNYPHDALFIWNNWGKIFFQKKITYQLRIPLVVFFTHF